MSMSPTFEGFFLYSGPLTSHVLLSCFSSTHYVPGIQMTLTEAVKLLIAGGYVFTSPAAHRWIKSSFPEPEFTLFEVDFSFSLVAWKQTNFLGLYC